MSEYRLKKKPEGHKRWIERWRDPSASVRPSSVFQRSILSTLPREGGEEGDDDPETREW